MYQCESCGSNDPEHICLEGGSRGNASTNPDIRAAELRQPTETEAAWRLRRVNEMLEEGLHYSDIGAKLGIGAESVRGIVRKERLRTLDEPLQSSLAMSLTNHTPDDAQLERIKEIRHKADELCDVIDRATLDTPETTQARIHLEETVMWAVKAVVLPRREGDGKKTFSRDQRERLGIRGDENP